MAKLVFGAVWNQKVPGRGLDGIHTALRQAPTALPPAWSGRPRRAGTRRGCMIPRYWNDDHPEWDAEEHAPFRGGGWRSEMKWVVSRLPEAYFAPARHAC